jgi:hypothetical protein
MAVLGSVSLAPSAQAEDWGVDITGTWSVYSDGAWARTNQVKFEQKSVLETWNVSTTCVSPIECTGTVTSSLGWTAPIRLDDFWFVEHEVPNWKPCPNGTFATGHQKFQLWGMNPAEERRITRDITTFAGRNMTKTNSGACGINNSTVIELPVRMEKLS